MRFKRILALALTVSCLFTCFAATAFAENASAYSIDFGIAPAYDIAESVSSVLNFVGTTAECVSKATGVNTAKITVEQTLQKYSGWFWIWDDVEGATWTKTDYSSSIYLLNTKSNLLFGKFRVKSVFTLTDKNGKIETLTIYSSSKSV